jgi:GMP synthase-like glutamine amidotransferase
MPKVAVLHNLACPFLGHVEAPLREAGLELDERRLSHGDPLPELDRLDGLIVLGGEASVAGGERGHEDQIALVREAVDRGVPVLGICLGGQILARALGGEVRRAGRVAAWRDVEVTPAAADDPLFAELPAPVPALHFNEDVFEPPPGAVELLVRAGEGAEAFRAGDAAWGLQYHPDADGPALEAWHREFAGYMAEAGVDPEALRAENARRAAGQEASSRALFAAFARVVTERSE